MLRPVAILSLLLLSVPLGCTRQRAPAKLPEITSESPEGFYDLVFSVRNYQKLPDGSQSIQAFGLYQDREVGIEVLFGPEWRHDSLGRSTVGIGTVMIRSVGPASDLFIVALDQIYGTHLLPRTMREGTPFNAMTLDGDPGDLKRGKVETKLFYEIVDAGRRNSNDDEDDSAELYANIDLKAGTLHINEKDEGYRRPIVQALRRF